MRKILLAFVATIIVFFSAVAATGAIAAAAPTLSSFLIQSMRDVSLTMEVGVPISGSVKVSFNEELNTPAIRVVFTEDGEMKSEEQILLAGAFDTVPASAHDWICYQIGEDVVAAQVWNGGAKDTPSQRTSWEEIEVEKLAKTGSPRNVGEKAIKTHMPQGF